MSGVEATERGFFFGGGRRAAPELSVNFGSVAGAVDGAAAAAETEAGAGEGSSFSAGCSASDFPAGRAGPQSSTGVGGGAFFSPREIFSGFSPLLAGSGFVPSTSAVDAAAISRALMTSPSNS